LDKKFLDNVKLPSGRRLQDLIKDLEYVRNTGKAVKKRDIDLEMYYYSMQAMRILKLG
jgi:hypothetical protein